MEKIKKKKTILIIIFSVLLITIAGTFAYLTWTKKIGRLVLRIGDLNTTEVRVSPYIIEGSFSPTLTYTGNTYTSVRVTNNKSGASEIILYYDIKNIDSALVSQYMKYMITKSESLNGTYTEYTSGNFSSVVTGEMVEILRESVPANTIYYYRVYLWIDGTTGNQNDMIGKNISLDFYAEILETIVEEPEPGSDMLVSKSNVESLTYANATDVQKKEMWAFSHPATSQVGATTDYRYIGSNPNNYIIFNGETWRIIGVFDGKIKIIRQDSLGELYWDQKKRNVGSSKSNEGSNDWTDSQLMYMLNSNWLTAGSEILKTGNTFDGTYVKDSNGKIIYQKGCLPAGASGTTYTCTSNTWSLNNTASSQVEKVTYYLGGASKASSSGSASYAFERGVKVPTNRPEKWSGYVGLSYPSDYIYTFANGVDDTCFNNGYNCDYSNANPASSWMKLMYTSGDHWFISPQLDTLYNTFIVHGGKGNVWYYELDYKEGVRPTVYLKANIKLQGDGTNSNPYQIQ